MNLDVTDLRSVIDTIALEVAERKDDTLEAKIIVHASAYIEQLRHHQRLGEREIDRITEAVVRGVLRRLLQIAESGGQIGTA